MFDTVSKIFGYVSLFNEVAEIRFFVFRPDSTGGVFMK